MSYRGVVQLIGLAVVALFVGLNGAYGYDTHTAASVAESAVQAAYDACSDGDTLAIPAGTATWTTTFVVSKAITIQGAGIDNTVIIDGVTKNQLPAITPNVFSVQAGYAMTRLTGFTLDGGTGDADNYNKPMMDISCGPYWRVDHIKFNIRRTCAAYINSIGGVLDSCDFEDYGAFVSVYVFNGGQNGDYAWTQSAASILGSTDEAFMEDNTFNCPVNGYHGAAEDGWNGTKLAFRHNTLTNMFGDGGHGSDSRNRSLRLLEFYNNSLGFDSNHGWVGMPPMELRGGTGVIYNNTITTNPTDQAQFGIYYMVRLSNYRDFWAPLDGGLYGCDGTGPYDLNDGSIYRQATHTGGNNSAVLTDSTANWTTNQWVGYSILNMSENDGTKKDGSGEGIPNFSIITSNTSTTITSMTWVKENNDIPIRFSTGDTYRIMRSTQAIDQCGAGAGDLFTGSSNDPSNHPLPVGWVHQGIDPIYAWGNTLNGSALVIWTDSLHVQLGTHFFNVQGPTGYVAYTYPHPLRDPNRPNIAPYFSAGPTCTPNPTDRVTTTTASVTAIDPDFRPQALSYTWTKTSGPGSVTFGSPNAASSTVTFGATGTYVLHVVASDGSLQVAADTGNIVVNNVAPQITAGPTATPSTITPAGSTTLSVTATDPDNQPAGLSYSWSKVSGSGTVTFGSPSQVSTTATFSQTGTYVLRVTVSDSVAQVTGDVTVQVIDLGLNLVAWWKLDETSGTSAADSSGNSNTGTLANGPTWTSGRMCGSLNFDGSNDYVDCGTGTSLRITGAMTVAAWVYMEDGYRSIVSKDSGTGNNSCWALRTNYGWGSPIPIFQIATSATTTALVQYGNGIPTNQWVHLAAVYDPAASGGPALKIYANGSLGNTTQYQVTATQHDEAGNHVALGMCVNGNGGNPYSGKLDDVRIYARALASNEIAALAGMHQDMAPQITSGPTCSPSPAGLTGASVSVTGNDPNNPPLTLSYGWSKVSGPGTVTFGTQAAATSTVTFSTSGTYTLRATVTNAVGSTTGDVQVTVNAAPQITAGPTCTPSPAQLTGASVSVTVTDSDGPSSLTYSWSKVSGSGTVTFGSQTAATSTVTFSASGTYTLRVDVYDGAAHTTGDVQVSVNAAPQITAGPTCTPTSPTLTNGSVSVTATDSDGPSGLTYSWSKVSGSGTVTFGSQTSATSTVTFSTTGTYTLRVDVYDGAAHTTGDVQVVVQSGVTGPVAWWKLNETSGTSAADSSGNSNTGTLTNGPAWSTGKVNGSLSFDGSNDYVDCGTGTSLRITGAMTVAAWVYMADGNHSIVSKDSGSGNNCCWALRTNYGGGVPIPVFHIATSASATTSVQYGNGIPVNQWVHLAGVYDPSVPALRIYVNGSLGNTSQYQVPATQHDEAGNHVALGMCVNGGGGEPFSGKMDEVVVYSRALSLSEIQALANPSSNQAPQITAGPTASPSTVDLPIGTSLSVTATDSDGPSSLTYSWSKVSGPGNVTFGNSTASTTTARFDATGTYSLQIDVYDGADHTTSTVQVTVSTSNMAAYWKLDDGSGTSAADCSGNSNTGTLTNGPAWSTGKVNGSLSFDGSNDYVDCGTGTSLRITGAMTVAAWVYMADGNHSIVSKDSGSGNNCCWALRTNYGGGVPIPVFHIATSASATTSVQYGNGIPVNQWVHLAAVYDPAASGGPALRIYVNGSLGNTSQYQVPATQHDEAGNHVALGMCVNGGGGEPFSGKMDEVVVYSRALSLSEIQALAAQP